MAQPNLTLVEGGKLKEAQQISESLAGYAKIIAENGAEIAGFVIVAWDAEGKPYTAWLHGKHSPIPRMMVPQAVKDALTGEIFK